MPRCVFSWITKGITLPSVAWLRGSKPRTLSKKTFRTGNTREDNPTSIEFSLRRFPYEFPFYDNYFPSSSPDMGK